MRDTRLVQTAVIGDEQSDVPVLLPSEAIELDAFRGAHRHDTFWCGLLLGGCGGQLATKLYLDRQCHFQHHPLPGGAPNPCHRPAVGESSADHLYVRSALSRSLLDYGRAARFAFPPPIGSLVDVELEDGHSLRIHMDSAVTPSWTEPGTVILGPGVVAQPELFTRCPYVYRVRCDSDGATRRVWIGTQSLAHATDWVPLGECSWTNEGLLTPAAARIRDERAAALGRATAPTTSPRPGAVPESVNRLVRGLEAAQRSVSVEHVRRLCGGSSTFLESLAPAARAEAERALAEARGWLAAHESFQRGLFDKLAAAVRDGHTWDIRTLLPQVTSLTRHGASAAEERVIAEARAALRHQDQRAMPDGHGVAPVRPAPAMVKWPQPGTAKEKNKQRHAAAAEARRLLRLLGSQARRLPDAELTRLVKELSRAEKTAGNVLSSSDREKIATWARRTRRSRASTAPSTPATQPRAGAPARDRRTKDRATAPKLNPLESAVKDVLEKTAAAGSTLTWQELRAQLPAGLPRIDPGQQSSILTRIDTSRGPAAPLLSALVTGADRDMHPAYPRIAAASGRAPGRGDLAAIAQWAMEVDRFRRPRSD